MTPLPILHLETEMHCSFAPNFPPPFRSWTAWSNKLPSCWPPPPVLHFLYCLTSTCYPGPCCTLQPCVTSLFLPSLPPSGPPPFAVLNVASAPVNPCGFSLLGHVLPPPVIDPPPPPMALTAGPVPSVPKGGRVSSPGLLPSSVVLPLHLILCCPISGVFWQFLFFGAFLRFFKRPGHLNYLEIAPSYPHSRAKRL